jgi:hypothetical protein
MDSRMACLEVIFQNGTFGRDQALVCRQIHAAEVAESMTPEITST